MAEPQRAGVRLFRDGGCGCRSGGRTGDHHRGFPYARDSEYRSGKPAQIMTPDLHLWLIPRLPLAGAAINGLLGKRFSRGLVTAIALTFCGAAFTMALWVAAQVFFSSLPLPDVDPTLATWLRSGDFSVDYSFALDQLSLIMLLVVTGVGFLIHIYSVGYMWTVGGF